MVILHRIFVINIYIKTITNSIKVTFDEVWNDWFCNCFSPINILFFTNTLLFFIYVFIYLPNYSLIYLFFLTSIREAITRSSIRSTMQGRKLHIFRSPETSERCFPEHWRIRLLELSVCKSALSGPNRVQGQTTWKFLLFRHFSAPKYQFCYALSSFFYCILSVILVDNIHMPKFVIFFSQWMTSHPRNSRDPWKIFTPENKITSLI